MTNSKETASDEWVVLNVGGKIFHTSTSTLTSTANTLLYKMFSYESKLPIARKDSNGAFLIDRDPKYFRVILNFLRQPNIDSLIIDDGISIRGVLQEAQFFHILPLIELIEKLEYNQSDFTRKDILLYKSSIKLNNKRLRNLDLSNLEFIKDNFNQSDISFCKFIHSKISHSTVLSVIAKHCIFNNVTAENTIFSNSNLKYSTFLSAELAHASFNNCQLSFSKFDNANCHGSLFQRAIILNGSFKNSNLEHAKFQKANLKFSDFSGAQIQNCHFTGADLRNCIFDWKSIPNNAIFKKAKITQQQFDEIQLSNKSQIGFKILELEDDLINNNKLNNMNINDSNSSVDSNSNSNNNNTDKANLNNNNIV